MLIFGTFVNVIAGFYIGCSGIVTDRYSSNPEMYWVELSCNAENGKRYYFEKVLPVTELKINK